MAYRRYSTDNADYAQVYCFHEDITYEDIFSKENIKNLDAIILESGRNLYALDVIRIKQYSKIEEAIRLYNPGLSVYLTDVFTKESPDDWFKGFSSVYPKIASLVIGADLAYYVLGRAKVLPKISRRAFLGISAGTFASGMLVAAPGLASNHLAHSEGDSDPILPWIVYTRYNFVSNHTVTMRDAINARKTEEYVAPLLRARFGHKPRIALVYGVGHAGLERCIKDKNHRDTIIDSFKDDFGLVFNSQLGIVVGMDYYRNKWHFNVLESGLF